MVAYRYFTSYLCRRSPASTPVFDCSTLTNTFAFDCEACESVRHARTERWRISKSMKRVCAVNLVDFIPYSPDTLYIDCSITRRCRMMSVRSRAVRAYYQFGRVWMVAYRDRQQAIVGRTRLLMYLNSFCSST